MQGSLEAVEEAVFMVFTDLVSDGGAKERRKFFQCVSCLPAPCARRAHPRFLSNPSCVSLLRGSTMPGCSWHQLALDLQDGV